MKPKEFIEMIKEPALNIEKEHGIPAAIIIAQAALETGWLRHQIEDKYTGNNSYNLFGIKAHGGWAGDTVTINTHEHINGKRVLIEDEFRAYDCFEDSIMDHMKFLFENPRYSKTLETDDPIEFARRLQAAGYATDPAYADKLISIMQTYDLLEIGLKDETDFANHWAKRDIKRCMEIGLFIKTDKFRPNDPMTRAEMAVVADRIIRFMTTEKRNY